MQGGKELKTISLLISPGQYTLGLRVTDNDSLTSTTTCTIYAAPTVSNDTRDVYRAKVKGEGESGVGGEEF